MVQALVRPSLLICRSAAKIPLMPVRTRLQCGGGNVQMFQARFVSFEVAAGRVVFDVRIALADW